MKELFSNYCFELVNLYKVRCGFNGDEARRYIIDMIDDVLESYNGGYSVQSVFEEDIRSWVE